MAPTKSSPTPTAPPQATAPVILTVEELALYLKTGESFVYERLRFRSGQDPHPMPAHKMGGYWRFLKHEIDEWLLSLPRTVPTRKRKYILRKKEALPARQLAGYKTRSTECSHKK